MTTKNKTEEIKYSKQALTTYNKTLTDCVNGLSHVLQSAKEAGAGIYKRLVEAHCVLNSLVWKKLTVKEKLVELKAVKKTLRPALCKAADISEISFNTYASAWGEANGYPKAETSTVKVKCSVCGKVGSWKKLLNDKKVCGECFKTSTEQGEGSDGSDNDGDMADHIIVSKDTVSITFTGNAEEDTDSIRSFLLSMLNDKDRNKLITPVINELVRMKMIKVA